MQQHLWDETNGRLKRSFCRNPSAVQGFADDYSYLIGQPHSHLAAACCYVLSHVLLLLAAVFSLTLAAACCYVASHGCVLTCVHATRCYGNVSLASLAVLGSCTFFRCVNSGTF